MELGAMFQSDDSTMAEILHSVINIKMATNKLVLNHWSNF
jgi:hypothetical protein